MKDNNKSSVFLLLCLFTTRNLQFDTHDLKKVSNHILKQQRDTCLQMQQKYLYSNHVNSINLKHLFPGPSSIWRRRYKSLGGFPRVSCHESAKATQFPHPGLKIGDQSYQIPPHARVCPRGHPPGMAADKCINSYVLYSYDSSDYFTVPQAPSWGDTLKNWIIWQYSEYRPSVEGYKSKLYCVTCFLPAGVKPFNDHWKKNTKAC